MRALAVTLCLGGCWSPQFLPCTVQCGTQQSCPASLSCGDDHFCHVPDEPRCTSDGSIDQSILLDGGPFDSAIGKDGAALDGGPGHTLWGLSFGGNYEDSANGVAIDKNGNVVVVGAFQSTVNFGGTPLQSAGGSDLFIARYSSSGSHLWSKRFGGSLDESAESVAVDPIGGDVVVTGRFASNFPFGATVLMNKGEDDIFLARLDAQTGNVKWAKGFGSTGEEVGRGVAVNGNGKIALVGGLHNSGSVGFDGNSYPGFGQADLFLTEYGLDGEYHFAHIYGTSKDDFATAVALGPGFAMVTGLTAGIGDVASAECSTCTAWVAKIGFDDDTTYGQVLRSATFPHAIGRAIAVDYLGEPAFAGSFDDDLTLDQVYQHNGIDLFVAQLVDAPQKSFSSVWAHATGGNQIDRALGLAVPSKGELVVVGGISDWGDFTCGDVTATAGDAFIARYASDGACVWSRTSQGDSGTEEARAVAVGPNGELVVVGRFNMQLHWAAPPLQTKGTNDAFVIKLAP